MHISASHCLCASPGAILAVQVGECLAGAPISASMRGLAMGRLLCKGQDMTVVAVVQF